MLLTKSQQQRFWREWSAACKTQGWTKAQSWTGLQIDNERHALLERAGFNSLTTVDRGPGFDRVLAELGRLTDNVARTVEVQNPEPGDRRRYLHLIEQHSQALGGLPYALAIARDQFKITTGLSTLEDLTTDQMYKLVMTLTARRHTRAKQENDRPTISTPRSTPLKDQPTLVPAGHNENNPF